MNYFTVLIYFIFPDLHPIVILTRVDELCEFTEDDTSVVFRSPKVKETVCKTHTGQRRMMILSGHGHQ